MKKKNVKVVFFFFYSPRCLFFSNISAGIQPQVYADTNVIVGIVFYSHSSEGQSSIRVLSKFLKRLFRNQNEVHKILDVLMISIKTVLIHQRSKISVCE